MAADGDDTRERVEGPTPHGGAYAIAYFRDDAGRPVPRGQASRMEIVEYSAAGAEIFRTYGMLGGAAQPPAGGATFFEEGE